MTPEDQATPGEQKPPSGPLPGGAPRLPVSYNWMSQIGLVLTVISVLSLVGIMVAGAVLPNPPAYMGLLTAPPLVTVVVGSALFAAGYIRERRRRARGVTGTVPVRIVIDFGLQRHRRLILGLFAGGVVVSIVFVISSFATFQTMSSNEFCGQVCHTVMKPEYTAHEYTAHARVKCVDCHVGSGVGWYVHSKLIGLRRLGALVTQSYTRPIPTPIEAMRPSRETCEQCHWPARFIGYKEKVHTYFTKGETNPEHKLRMLLKIGGTDSTFTKGFGIHYHMLGPDKVEYVARDRQRQEIAWVRVTKADGKVVEYNNEDFPLGEKERQAIPPRRMECLDCHNRPAHEFKSPMDAVDEAMAAGTLTRTLPFIKVRAVKALDGKYESTADADKGIAESINAFYQESYPDLMTKKAAELNKTIGDLQGIYRTEFFPEMKAKWSAYPNNIGHRDWPGCFRCHSDKMKTAEGKSVFTDCSRCHLILAQGKSVDRSTPVDFNKGAAFDHPGYDEKIKDYTKCIDCHTGGGDLY